MPPSSVWGARSHRLWPGAGSAAPKIFLPTREDSGQIVQLKPGLPAPMSSGAWRQNPMQLKAVAGRLQAAVKTPWKAYRHQGKGAMSRAGAARQVKVPGSSRLGGGVQKTSELPQTPPLRAKGEQSLPGKDRAINSRRPDNAMSKHSNSSSHSAVRKCRARLRLIAHGMAAAPALLVTVETPVLRVPNNRPGKARHLSDNAM